jgi:class 3 adenylate cyclase
MRTTVNLVPLSAMRNRPNRLSLARLATTWLLGCCGAAHAGAPPVVFTGQPAIAFRQLEALPDPDGRLTIDDVTSPDVSSRFAPAAAFDGKVTQSKVYWLRVTIDNPQAAARTVALFPINTWSEVQLYSEAEAYRMRRSGLQVPVAERDIEVTHRAEGLVPYLAVRAVLAPSSATTVYLRASSDWRYGAEDQLAIEISDLGTLRAEERMLRPVVALIFGILVALALYHLMLLFGLRDGGYAFYVIHITGIALVGPTIFGMMAEYASPQHPAWVLDALVVQKALVIVGLVQFTRIFLETRRTLRWLDLALRVVIVGCVLVVVAAPFAGYRTSNLAMSPLLQLAYVLALTAGIVALVRRNPLARYFVAANVFTFAGIAAAIAGEFELLPGPLWGSFGPQIGTALEALLLSRGLAYRMNLMKAELAERRVAEERLRREQEEERRTFLEEQKAALEHKVRERTEELSELNRTLEQRVAEQVGQVERLSQLRRFLSPKVADMIVSGQLDDPLATRRREVTIVFVDLRGFTAFSETAAPEDVLAVLRDYHGEVGRLVNLHEGTIEHFAGDGVMLIFNDPTPLPDPALAAVRMAIELRDSVARLADSWGRLGYRLGCGLGIAQGYATIGTIGFPGRQDYGVVGAVNNLAARLCAAAAAGQVLVSQRVFSRVQDKVVADPVGEIDLKGFREPIAAYNVIAMKAASPESLN